MELARDERSEEDEEDGADEPSATAKKTAKIRAQNARAEALQDGRMAPASQTLGEKAG